MTSRQGTSVLAQLKSMMYPVRQIYDHDLEAERFYRCGVNTSYPRPPLIHGAPDTVAREVRKSTLSSLSCHDLSLSKLLFSIKGQNAPEIDIECGTIKRPNFFYS